MVRKSKIEAAGKSQTAPAVVAQLEFNGKPRLTPRECEVVLQIAHGASNKEVGRSLGISPRTVETHRARIMEKIGARNAADLVRIVLGGGVPRPALAAQKVT
jgi:DNA-binding CsgD family transcriptional regulator